MTITGDATRPQGRGRAGKSALVTALVTVAALVGLSVATEQVASATPSPIRRNSATRTFIQIAGGNEHTCSLVHDGTVECWGWGLDGQLGDGATTSSDVPVAVSGLSHVIQVAAGGNHSCALLDDGTAKCWGDNTFGALGDGTYTSRSTPVAVSGLSGATAIAAGVDGEHTCALISNGTVKCWGYNSSGQLGNGSTTTSNIPVSVSFIGGSYTPAVAVSASEKHGCALLVDGTIKCWGLNASGQLGNGNTTEQHTPVAVSNIGGASTTAKAVDCGYESTCAVMSDGSVKCWGENLGNGTSNTSSTPVSVSGIGGWLQWPAIAISVGESFTCANINNGTIQCWGDNTYGQLGNGNTTNQLSPVTVLTGGGSNELSSHVAAGGYHSCNIAPDGEVDCWGYNGDGELGNGTTTNSVSPVSTGLTAAGYEPQIAAGDDHTCGLTSTGQVKCWGYNADGEVGDGTTTNRSTPVSVSLSTKAVSICTGGYHSCAVLADSTIECWGYNGYGELGDGTTTNRTSPVAVANLQNAVSVACSYYGTCALMGNGTVECWGYNAYGQVGNGTTTNESFAQQVSNLTGATDVNAEFYTNCARTASGTVECWGYNGNGECGDGTLTTPRTTPVHAMTVTGAYFTGAAASGTAAYEGCAILASGSADCWGENSYGECGDGTTTLREDPVSVSSFSAAVAIGGSGGGFEKCGLLANGDAMCWGYNYYGEVGDGNTTNVSTPQNVVSSGSVALAHATAVSNGYYHGCAMISDGTAVCWGYGGTGCLGNGGTTSSDTYVTVSSFP